MLLLSFSCSPSCAILSSLTEYILSHLLPNRTRFIAHMVPESLHLGQEIAWGTRLWACTIWHATPAWYTTTSRETTASWHATTSRETTASWHATTTGETAASWW